MARGLSITTAYAISACERKKVGMLSAHLKRIPRLDRLHLRERNGAKDKFLLAASVQNIRKLAKLTRCQPRRCSLNGEDRGAFKSATKSSRQQPIFQ